MGAQERRVAPPTCVCQALLIAMVQYEICVKNRKQQILLFNVEATNTIKDLKKSIEEKTGVNQGEQQPLYFNGLELTDEEATLLEYGVVPDDCPGGPIVMLGTSAWVPFYVNVFLPDGRRHNVLVTITTTVGQLKGRITTEMGVPYLMQKLIVDGKELQNDLLSMGDLEVPPNCKVVL